MALDGRSSTGKSAIANIVAGRRSWKEEVVEVGPAPVILIDGVYSARPELADLVDLKVLVEAEDEVQRERLVQREGREFMERWHRLWDAAEDYYFRDVCPRSSFDVVVRNDENPFL